MPEICTCGAQLPPDALFCHKCGKPQREILPPDVPAPEEQPPAPPPRPAFRETLPLDFHNRAAVRIALIVAVGSTLVFFFLPFLNWVFGGFLAVFLYRRRTGFPFNLGAGMRMGWLTGVLAFVLYIVPFAIEVPRMNTLMEERLREMRGVDAVMRDQMIRFFQSSAGMTSVVILSLMAMFLIITFLSMAGGALGAKVIGRQ
ncbi:MAG: zinc ribbon domain-containing protein [Acidobacteriia bacterium]|nr:zinc ribbon domain-containing protein [Terriglobia bacterium]